MALVDDKSHEIFEEIKNPIRSVRLKTKAVVDLAPTTASMLKESNKNKNKSRNVKSAKIQRVVANPKNLLKIKIICKNQKIGKKSKSSAVTLKYFGKVERILDLPIYIKKVSGTKTLGELFPNLFFTSFCIWIKHYYRVESNQKDNVHPMTGQVSAMKSDSLITRFWKEI